MFMVLCNFYLCTNLRFWNITLISKERDSFIPGLVNLVSKRNSCTMLCSFFQKLCLILFLLLFFSSFGFLIAIFKCPSQFGHIGVLVLYSFFFFFLCSFQSILAHSLWILFPATLEDLIYLPEFLFYLQQFLKLHII